MTFEQTLIENGFKDTTPELSVKQRFEKDDGVFHLLLEDASDNKDETLWRCIVYLVSSENEIGEIIAKNYDALKAGIEELKALRAK